MLKKVIFTALGGLLGAVGCNHHPVVEPHGGDAVINLSVRSSAAAQINRDLTAWEDRVDEIRMIVFSTGGGVVYNALLEFPDGMDKRCRPVQITPGTYDFCFIANETATDEGLPEALSTLKNKSDMETNPLFANLAWSETFTPDGTTSDGRFVMSAEYEGIDVLAGGTIDNPTLLQLPEGKVELERAMAKVEVIFRKKEPGSTVPSGSVSSVGLGNVAQYMSGPATGEYYHGTTTATSTVTPVGLAFTRDSIGAVVWYIPEQLNRTGETAYTQLLVGSKAFAVSSAAPHSIERNANYKINAYITPQGGIELEVCIEPWNRFEYKYMFQEEDRNISIPPVFPTDSSVIVPTNCGTVEILSHTEVLSQGLMGAFGDHVNWYDPAVGGPTIIKGAEPYYCEKKYGPGWRFINSCEIMSFLQIFDQAYRVWQGNTWLGINNGLKSQSLPFRQEAQVLLGKLTGYDMSKFTPKASGQDDFGGEKLGMIDQFFTPGDILVRESDYGGNWPFAGKPNNNGLAWYPMEVSIQVKAYWYSDYIDISQDANLDKILYLNFAMYDYSSTVSRCVRSIE
jgi:hypothetical protein